MALTTTTLGAYPKPGYLPGMDWFQAPDGPDTAEPTVAYEGIVQAMGAEAEALFARAAGDAIADQEAAGIDVVTDGEVRRENYIHYHCRHLAGIDFARLVEKPLRQGAYAARLPSVTGRIAAGAPFLPDDWRVAQALTERPVKVTLPGPMTISDTIVDQFYGDPRRLGADLGTALNAEVRALAEAGVRHVQVDEPVFARQVDAALAYGFDNLERCLHGIDAGLETTVHVCCGYPDRLDNLDYPKAPKEAYFDLAPGLEASSFGAVSIEDAHRPNDLALLEAFARTAVVFGAFTVARSRIESADEIEARLAQALAHIDASRLIVAPDCGLGLLDRADAMAKLTNMVTAAKRLG